MKQTKDKSYPQEELHTVQTGRIIGGVDELVGFLKSNRGKEFTMTDIRRLGLFPWATDYRTIRKLFMSDWSHENLLRARIEGEGKQTRFYAKGANIIIYIKKYGPALMATVRKPKQKSYGNKSEE